MKKGRFLMIMFMMPQMETCQRKDSSDITKNLVNEVIFEEAAIQTNWKKISVSHIIKKRIKGMV